MKLIFVFSAAILLLFTAEAKDYSSHVVISIRPSNELQEKTLIDLINNGDVQTWKHPKDGLHYLVVEDHVYQKMKGTFSKIELIMDGEMLIKAIADTKRRDPRSGRAVDWTSYNTLDEINEYMETLATENPNLATTSTLGITWEGREMKMITITSRGDSSSGPLIVLDAGIHAREWVAPATATYIMNALLTDPIIQDATFVVIPSLNPDGYQFTWDSDRFWRKTRSDRPELLCAGVDGNRNWDYEWMTIGASNVSCSEIYAGPYPNSEPEFQALADYMNANADRAQLYITLHSYGQLFMYPYGHTTDLPPTWVELDRVSVLATEAMFAVHGAFYDHGSTGEILGYLDAGTSRDYMYAVVGVPYVYTIELRDNGETGFALPPEQILPTAEETWAGFLVAAQEALAAMP